ncbi:YciI family protein [Phytohabitans houttuyneae]|uniref:Transcription initiation protein n=1 Tax=Phytohabitans houttuyneae TaxID=1076126 RepID=A0A6V8KCS2_9ACTN|nr:YciI family protein [Phytohabitans houttuyneae]GFJ83042.1 transcription initiation protein [Phytohabitans houttuyneae]
MKYVLMFAETEQFAADLAAMDDAERERAYARVGQWFADNREQITRHVHLMPPETATTMRLGGGEPVVTDGPFVEGKEVVSGIAEVDVDDLDAALRLARSWPGCPLVEIRPIAST